MARWGFLVATRPLGVHVRCAAAAVAVAASVGVAAVGCTPGRQSVPAQRDVITAEEIASADALTAYDAVERLRPLWLRTRGERSIRLSTEIVVYQDQTMLGDVEMLRGIPAHLIQSIRALDAADAGRLPGLGSRHVERAILVVLR